MYRNIRLDQRSRGVRRVYELGVCVSQTSSSVFIIGTFLFVAGLNRKVVAVKY